MPLQCAHRAPGCSSAQSLVHTLQRHRSVPRPSRLQKQFTAAGAVVAIRSSSTAGLATELLRVAQAIPAAARDQPEPVDRACASRTAPPAGASARHSGGWRRRSTTAARPALHAASLWAIRWLTRLNRARARSASWAAPTRTAAAGVGVQQARGALQQHHRLCSGPALLIEEPEHPIDHPVRLDPGPGRLSWWVGSERE